MKFKVDKSERFSADGDFVVEVRDGVAYVIPLTASFTKVSQEPKFKHDCSDCLFLYQWDNDDFRGDIYFCEKENTVVARYGDRGYQYISGISGHMVLSYMHKMLTKYGVAK